MQAIDIQEGKRLVKTHVCAECGGELTLPWGGAYGIENYVIRCGENPDHEGFVKPKSYTQAYNDGDPLPIEIANRIEDKRRKQMTQQVGEQEAKALQPYYGVHALTQEQATTILRTIWPKAPDVEVFKAALICKAYGLNPLMKHLYLLEFKGKEGSTWAPVLGIGATRLIASRIGRYSYVDGPRIMTEKEQKEILGEVDEANIWAITVLRDERGNEAPGYGAWNKDNTPYGMDKGNTKANMAMIRSERNAFNRLFPGEMPADIEAIDTSYLTLPKIEEQPASKQPSPGAVRAGKGPTPHQEGAPNGTDPNLASQAQVNAIHALLRDLGADEDVYHADLKARFDVEHTNQLTKAQASRLIDELQKKQQGVF